ncbi:MAG: hypothetical protein PHI97_19990, partial [Desulfobulbus sp.]|nr:hypothetical protein [Desulfobulbus sp.]
RPTLPWSSRFLPITVCLRSQHVHYEQSGALGACLPRSGFVQPHNPPDDPLILKSKVSIILVLPEQKNALISSKPLRSLVS